MLRPGTGIQLFGLPPAQSSFEKAKGVVVSFNSRLDRYIKPPRACAYSGGESVRRSDVKRGTSALGVAVRVQSGEV